MYQNDKMYQLYQRLADTITESVKELSNRKKIREIECQLLKIILLNTTPPPVI